MTKTIRILEIDGGGIRGIFSAQFMKLFCAQAGIVNIWQAFDIIVGTSIGGISALGYAKGLTPDDILELLISKGPDIFTYKVPPAYITTAKGPVDSATLGYTLVTPGVNPFIYENIELKKALTSVLGTTKMFQLKTNVLITSFSYLGGTPGSGDYSEVYFPYSSSDTTVKAAIPVHFSNAILPFTKGQNSLAVDVGLTTSAAPVYFPPVQLSDANDPTNDRWYIDGGLYQNNATALGYTMAKMMFPSTKRISILSVGTGIVNVGFDVPITATYSALPPSLKIAPTNSLPMFADLLSMTIGGAQEAVDQQFKYISLYNGIQEQLYYYRFQTVFPPDFPGQLDNVENGFAENLINCANRQYEVDQLKISAFIQNAGF